MYNFEIQNNSEKICPPYLDQYSWSLRRREGDIVHEMGYVSKKQKKSIILTQLID